MPRWPLADSVTAIATITPATLPCVVKVFRPVQDPARPCPHRHGSGPGGVTPGVGFGETPRPERLTMGESGKVTLALRRRAEQSPLCAATHNAIDGSTRASSSMQMQ